MSGRGKG
ncbi:hypothetical protein A2U01_0083140, partial [Trifolium medium]|nr:hypothetical protein [Trifolium medium]